MSSELEPTRPTALDRLGTQRKYRKQVPEAHRKSIDTRLRWLWNQKWGTVQAVLEHSRINGDVLDYTAANLIFQAVVGKDLESISQLLNRIEGGTLTDTALAEREETTIRV